MTDARQTEPFELAPLSCYSLLSHCIKFHVVTQVTFRSTIKTLLAPLTYITPRRTADITKHITFKTSENYTNTV